MVQTRKNIMIGNIAIVALLAAALITVAAVSNNTVFAKKPDDDGGNGKDKKKKDNIKVQIKINGIPIGTSAVSTTLIVAGGNPMLRTQTIDANETSISVLFNKVIAAKGDSFTVSVNDRIVDGKIADIKKPNKVIVNLS